jgi:hypothetical protein
MAENNIDKETFEAFRKSFFYGERSDMSFKFLEHLSDEDAGKMLQALFKHVVSAIDTGDTRQLQKTLIKGQLKAHANPSGFEYSDGPFAPFVTNPQKSVFTLLTSSGHFPCAEDPNPLGISNMSQQDAEQKIMSFLKEKPELTEIPFSIAKEELCVRHGGYDISATLQDANITFPWQRLNEFCRDGIIGSLTQNAYSFVGACSQKRLLKKSIPAWTRVMFENKVQGAILIPV